MIRRVSAIAAILFLCTWAIITARRPAEARLLIVTVAAPAATLTLEVARSDADERRGLMYRRMVDHGHGMLFVFAADAPRHFWMEHTLVPLDMIFIDAGGRVTSIAANVPASKPDEPDFEIARRDGYGRFVIELPAGEAESDGIMRGGRLKLPSFP